MSAWIRSADLVPHTWQRSKMRVFDPFNNRDEFHTRSRYVPTLRWTCSTHWIDPVPTMSVEEACSWGNNITYQDCSSGQHRGSAGCGPSCEQHISSVPRQEKASPGNTVGMIPTFVLSCTPNIAQWCVPYSRRRNGEPKSSTVDRSTILCRNSIGRSMPTTTVSTVLALLLLSPQNGSPSAWLAQVREMASVATFDRFAVLNRMFALPVLKLLCRNTIIAI